MIEQIKHAEAEIRNAIERDKNLAMPAPQQRLMTDFVWTPPSSLSGKKVRSVGTPIFNLDDKVPSSKKRRRVTIGASDQGQQIIDAGQKMFGTQLCKQCGMIYSANCSIDMNSHETYHNRATNLSYVKITPNQLASWRKTEYCQQSDNIYVMSVKPSSSSSLKSRVENIMKELVNQDIGYATTDESIWGVDGRNTVWIGILEDNTTLYMAGIIVTEILKEARWSDTGEPFADGSYLLGVKRLWTHRAARRRGVGRRILDVIRQRCLLGCILPRRRVAFCEPTKDGRSFAASYCSHPKENAEKQHHYLEY